MSDVQDIDQLAAALVAFQAEMPAVQKNSENPFFHSKYADMADVVAAAQPVLAKHELAVSQFLSHEGDRNTLVTYLIHSSGQFIKDEMLLMLPKDDPQGQGSATTYARRYAYSAALGIVTDSDDDGNAAASSRRQADAAAEASELEIREARAHDDGWDSVEQRGAEFDRLRAETDALPEDERRLVVRDVAKAQLTEWLTREQAVWWQELVNVASPSSPSGSEEEKEHPELVKS